MMSADVACNITLNGFVNPRVYEQTFRATINVGSVMLFMLFMSQNIIKN